MMKASPLTMKRLAGLAVAGFVYKGYHAEPFKRTSHVAHAKSDAGISSEVSAAPSPSWERISLFPPRAREVPKRLDENKLLQGKRLVAFHAVNDFVRDGMTVGMGTGTTCWHVVEELGRKIRNNDLCDIKVVPCSVEGKKHCISVGIPVSALSFASGQLDLMIDGADEVDVTMALLKGGSGSFLREKMMEGSSDQVVIVADESKLVRGLGPGHPLPVEVICWDYERTIHMLENLPDLPGCRGVLRRGTISSSAQDGEYPAITDNGNFIVDLYFRDIIPDLAAASMALDGISGVVEHGIFAGYATTILIATSDKTQPLRVIGHYPIAPEKAEQPWWYENNPYPYARETIDHRIPVTLPVPASARNRELVNNPNEAPDHPVDAAPVLPPITHSQGLDYGEEYLQQTQRENSRGRQEVP